MEFMFSKVLQRRGRARPLETTAVRTFHQFAKCGELSSVFAAAAFHSRRIVKLSTGSFDESSLIDFGGPALDFQFRSNKGV
jgi:hypothetical protein